jgi:hypothetical protein
MFLKSDKPQINNNNAIQSNKKKTGKKDVVKEVHFSCSINGTVILAHC